MQCPQTRWLRNKARFIIQAFLMSWLIIRPRIIINIKLYQRNCIKSLYLVKNVNIIVFYSKLVALVFLSFQLSIVIMPLRLGMSGLGPKLVRLAQNRTNQKLFQIRFQYHFSSASQNLLKSDLKKKPNPHLSNLGQIWPTLGSK